MTQRTYAAWSRTLQERNASEGEWLIYRFCTQLRSKRGAGKVDRTVLEELAARLESIVVDNVPPAKALGLVRKRGRQEIEPTEFWLRVEVAAAVIQQKRLKPRRTIERIADDLVPAYAMYKFKPSAIKDCYERYKDEAAVALDVLAGGCIDTAFEYFRKRGHVFVSINPPKSPTPRK